MRPSMIWIIYADWGWLRLSSPFTLTWEQGFSLTFICTQNVAHTHLPRLGASRLWVVPHCSSGTRENHPMWELPALSPLHLTFLAWDDFHVCSRFACSTIPEEKWGTSPILCHKSTSQVSWWVLDKRLFSR